MEITLDPSSTITPADIESVELGYIVCPTHSLDVGTMKITCTLGSDPITGDSLPLVKTALGYLPVDGAVTAHTQAIDITTVSGIDAINDNGG